MKAFLSLALLALSFTSFAQTSPTLKGDCAVKATEFLSHVLTNSVTKYGLRHGKKNLVISKIVQLDSEFDEVNGTTVHQFNVIFKETDGQVANEAGYEIIMGADKDSKGNNLNCYLVGFSMQAG